MTQFEDHERFQPVPEFGIAISQSMGILERMDMDPQRVSDFDQSEINRLLPNSSNPVLTAPNTSFYDFTSAPIDGTHVKMHTISNTMHDWRSKNVADWSTHDTCFWVQAVADTVFGDLADALPYINKFTTTSGTELVLMTESDMFFKVLNSDLSTRLYGSLKDIINRFQYSHSCNYEDLTTPSLSTLEASQAIRIFENPAENQAVYNNFYNDFEQNYVYENHPDSGYEEDCVSNEDSSSDSEQYDEEKCQIKMEEPNEKGKKSGPTKRGPGRPPGTKKVKPEKIGKVWEFIRDLLLDPSTNPSVICWVDQDKGIFRFVQSDKAARLWGIKKNNPKMTFDKLTRAMRYYYKHGVLCSSTKRLVYSFGPNASGWKSSKSNSIEFGIDYPLV